MIIDKKGRLFGKVSFIDIAVIAVIILGVCLVAFKFGKSGAGISIASAKEDSMTISFYVPNALEYAADSIKIGDVIHENVSLKEFGTVKECKISDPAIWKPDKNGKLTATRQEGVVSLTLTAECKGIYSDVGGVTLAGINFCIGDQRVVRIGNARLNLIVTDIKLNGGNP